MRPLQRSRPGRSRHVMRPALVAAGAALALSGCSASSKRGYLPEGVTSDSDQITSLWTGSWIAALGVGVLVWGLIIWCVVAYRRRKDDDDVPVQLRYNLPLEILYTVVPLFMIAVLFYFTAQRQSDELSISNNADNIVHVVGKRWAWDFNYSTDGVYESSVQTDLTGQPSDDSKPPVLYLPVNRSTRFVLTARDVAHSFWVPAFLRKLDMIPGVVNTFEVKPTVEGTYRGKCAELCGTYHSQMLFQVKVVSQDVYDKHIAELKAKGQVGELSYDLNQEPLQPGQEQKIPTPGGTS